MFVCIYFSATNLWNDSNVLQTVVIIWLIIHWTDPLVCHIPQNVAIMSDNDNGFDLDSSAWLTSPLDFSSTACLSMASIEAAGVDENALAAFM